MTSTVLIALLGGIVPSVVWLLFWLFEDRCAPEPKTRILFTFLAGMAMVRIALPVELKVGALYSGVTLLFLWAATEEVLKLGAASLLGLWSKAYDEPLDAVIYLVTAALGFSAAENAMYLFTAAGNGYTAQNLLSGDLRFVGATLLHILASATVGLCMAYAFQHSKTIRLLALGGGVILAIALHTLFNFFILAAGGAQALIVFLPIWLGIVAILALLERIKNPSKDYC